MRTVFMGTPDFAVPSLQRLSRIAELTAVFCQPDRPAGRSRKLQACPVKQAAAALGIEVHQPKRIRARKWVGVLERLAPDLIVVAAFGQILPQPILDIPRFGCINVHASLLPRWRGASPIHFAILSGDRETGISIMKMELGLDSGPVYARRAIAIHPDQGRRELEEKLAVMGADLLAETLPGLHELKPETQNPDMVTLAPMVTKEMGYCRFDNQSAIEIKRMIQAFESWPGTVCGFRGQPLKLLKATVADPLPQARPGALRVAGKSRLFVACATGTALEIAALQPAGKKPQTAAAFINGYRPRAGESLESMGED